MGNSSNYRQGGAADALDGEPQQNGRHERMHLTLKQETASPPADSLAEQLVRFSVQGIGSSSLPIV